MEKKVEVKQVSEREIWVGENRMYLGEDNILYITLVGEMDEKMAIAFIEAVQRLENMVDGKVNLFADINKAGKQSPVARELYRERTETSEKLGKVAIFGLHPVARVLASFVMEISQKKDMRFFKTKEEALAWLKGDE